MQLINDKREIGLALTAATLTLLGVNAPLAEAKGKAGEWDIDTAVLFYSETDGRVSAVEPVAEFTRNYDDDRKLTLKAVADALTGASPSGATPSDQAQTFTRPSGKGDYTVSANENPLDNSFHDTRGALSATWSSPLGDDYAYSVGAYGSGEYDYMSLGLNGTISRYLNNKNTTLNAGLSVSADSISPEGGIPVAFSRMALRANKTEEAFQTEFDASRQGSSDNKTLIDVLLGVTQVVNRSTIMQFNYSLSMADGYMTDPFKILSVIDDTPGAGLGTNAIGADGNAIYVYENRPDSRMKHALYWQTRHMLDNGDVIDGSYRFMIDDWGISSHTVDVHYRYMMGKSYLEPHARVYLQSEADFYTRYLTTTEYNGGTPTVTEATADYRLGEMLSGTLGLKWGYHLTEDHEVSVRGEYMKQTSTGDEGIGALATQGLYPDTDAFWLQLGYTF
ncbi:MAG: DUF3570 domain-containing protein [Hahellaceae bacterium]|nr:DUF3570 domain-containing protein [Hahellaceae bacterium]